jgi:DNA processing protein
MRDDLEHILRLSLTPFVGSKKYRELINAFGSPKAVFNASQKELLDVEGVGVKTARAISRAASSDGPAREIKRAGELCVDIIGCTDERFPEQLLDIPDAPIVLYVKGDARALTRPAIAVVGCRRNTFYGRTQAERIAAELARYALVVTSGLARGIDTAAHRGALTGGGQTVAVLGCGVDVVYPPENKELIEEVASHGAVVSEFPFNTTPEPKNFPRRNRIISGLSAGVFVVEAGQRSGALITASYALDQGKPVFAMPGPVSSAQSRGTHRLLRDGAVLVEEALDIIREVAPTLVREQTAREEAAPIPENLGDDERAVFDLLTAEPRHIDFFVAKTGLDVSRVQGLMLRLQMKKLAQQLAGNQYVRSF